MEFCIQASSPRGSGAYEPEDESLGEAVETAFLLDTESAILWWHHFGIALSYKYDVSVIIADLKAMLVALGRPGPSSHEVQWASNTFLARWVLEWDIKDVLTVTSEWTSVVGTSEDALATAGAINVSKIQFVAEWKEVLGRVLSTLDASGYTQEQIAGFADLRRIWKEIPQSGLLYR